MKNLYNAKPVVLYIFNKPAEGALKRLFKNSGEMFDATASSPATDATAIAEAEKRIGSEKED